MSEELLEILKPIIESRIILAEQQVRKEEFVFGSRRAAVMICLV